MLSSDAAGWESGGERARSDIFSPCHRCAGPD
jgi:hypothetical protein